LTDRLNYFTKREINPSKSKNVLQWSLAGKNLQRVRVFQNEVKLFSDTKVEV